MMTPQELIKEYEEYAASNGFKLNPDRKIVEAIVKGLLMREEKNGARYCPCRRVTGDIEEDKKIICPCIYHKEEIEKDGHCHCNIFVKA
jgi:ferredoxin-thioredoxin reductase catalytic chain